MWLCLACSGIYHSLYSSANSTGWAPTHPSKPNLYVPLFVKSSQTPRSLRHCLVLPLWSYYILYLFLSPPRLILKIFNNWPSVSTAPPENNQAWNWRAARYQCLAAGLWEGPGGTRGGKGWLCWEWVATGSIYQLVCKYSNTDSVSVLMTIFILQDFSILWMTRAWALGFRSLLIHLSL